MAGPGPWDWLSLKVGLRKYSPPRSAQLHTHANTHRGMCTCRSTYSPSPGGFSVATAVCLLALAGGDKTERGEYGGRYGNRQIAVKGMLPWKRGQNMRKGTCALAHTSLMFSSPPLNTAGFECIRLIIWSVTAEAERQPLNAFLSSARQSRSSTKFTRMQTRVRAQGPTHHRQREWRLLAACYLSHT